MGDTASLVHGFSYALPLPNESIQGNAKHALGESISFGRFMTDQSLSWEKWSTFSHKKYVEEAEKYARPGSVAQKKAFFEAHYKKIAARKAAALLEQQNAAKTESEGVGDDNSPEKQTANSHADTTEEVKMHGSNNDGVMNVYNERSSIAALENDKDGENAVNIKNNVTRSTKKSRLDSERSSSRSLRALLGLVPIKEPDKEVISKTESSPKDTSEPFGNQATAPTNGVSSYTEPTPQSETRRSKVPVDPSTPESKTGLKWRIFSAICSKSLRARRDKRQKFDEKFNADDTQKVEIQKTLKAKPGNGFRKLSCSFCFNAQPMIDLYKDTETPGNQIEKATATQPRPAEFEKNNSNKTKGSISVPPPPPPPTYSVKNSPSKILSKK